MERELIMKFLPVFELPVNLFYWQVVLWKIYQDNVFFQILLKGEQEKKRRAKVN